MSAAEEVPQLRAEVARLSAAVECLANDLMRYVADIASVKYRDGYEEGYKAAVAAATPRPALSLVRTGATP